MTIYNYDLSNDFINGVNPTCLHRTIIEFGFDNTLNGVSVEWDDDDVLVNFEGDLTAGEIDDLNTLVDNHNPIFTCDKELSLDIGSSKVDFALTDHSEHEYIYNNSQSWKIGRSFIYDGSLNWVLKKFAAIASMKSSSATGSLRLYDQTNNKEICLLNWSGNDKQILSTETFNNLPDDTALFELQLKTSKNGQDARLHYIALY